MQVQVPVIINKAKEQEENDKIKTEQIVKNIVNRNLIKVLGLLPCLN